MSEEQKVGHVYIPAHIMERTDLRLVEKVLYGKIIGLVSKDGFCYASNDWLCNQIGVSQSYVSNSISKFVRLELLNREIIRNEKKEIIQRKLFPFVIGITSTSDRGITPTSEDIQEILDPRDESNAKPSTKKNDVNYLLTIPPEDIQMFSEKYGITAEQVKDQGEGAYHWGLSHGKRYSDYKHRLHDWIRNSKKFDTKPSVKKSNGPIADY